MGIMLGSSACLLDLGGALWTLGHGMGVLLLWALTMLLGCQGVARLGVGNIGLLAEGTMGHVNSAL